MHAKQANQFFSIINANFVNFRNMMKKVLGTWLGKVFRHRQFDEKFP